MKKLLYLLPLLLLCFAFAPKAHAAITFDASSTSADNQTPPVSWTHTVGSGSNGILILLGAAGGYNSTLPSPFIDYITGASYDGLALSSSVVQTGLGYSDAEIWYLLNPPAGANTMVVSTTLKTPTAHQYQFSAASFFGVNQTTPIDATSSATGTGATTSISITPANNNDWVLDSLNYAISNYVLVPGGSQTEIYHTQQYQNNGYGTGAFIGPVSPASTQSLTWSGGSTTFHWADVAISLEPAGGAPPTPTPPPIILWIQGFVHLVGNAFVR